MIRETLVVRKTLWLALRKQLIGDYGNLDFECEVLLLNDPQDSHCACADGGDVVNVTITYNPLDIALDIRKTRERGGRRGRPLRGKKAINVPLA